MQDQSARKAAEKRATHELFENIACPFCGMLCDDLEIENRDGALKVLKNGCGRSVTGFERKLPLSSPQIKGKDVTLAEAVKEAAALIGKADCPLFGGLATGVEGMRAVMALAERAGGVVDHALSEGQYRNVKVLQSAGWITSTLTETRNRADLLIVVGSDTRKLHPRFFERIVSPPDFMFDDTAPKRTVVFIGEGRSARPPRARKSARWSRLPCDAAGLAKSWVHSARSVRPLATPKSPVHPARRHRGACREMPEGEYGVVVWAPPSLDCRTPISPCIWSPSSSRNSIRRSRFAGLVARRQRGRGHRRRRLHLADRLSAARQLRQRHAGLRPLPLFDRPHDRRKRRRPARLGCLDRPDMSPPTTTCRRSCSARRGCGWRSRRPSSFPVGTPGIDHAGQMVRCDNVVSLPLKNLGRSQLPRAADVLAAIEAAL